MNRLMPQVFILLALGFLLMPGCGENNDDDDDGYNGDYWAPSPGTSWQWQLTGAIDTSVAASMYDIDLFEAPQATIDALRDTGRIVICYFSAGSWEEWREDADEFPAEALGNTLEGWPDERWLDIENQTVRQILAARLDLAAAKKCDGVEPDNVDGFANDNGLNLTAAAQLAFNRWLADEAHARGLSVGLKNDLDQLDDLRDRFDWALNEECVAYDECDRYDNWLAAGKAVFHVEYVDDWVDAQALADAVCGVKPEMDTLIKTWDLGPERLACPGD